MDNNIPENSEKGNLRRFFMPVFVVLVAVASFGLGKLSKIESMRSPVSVEWESGVATSSIEAPTKLGAVAAAIPATGPAKSVSESQKSPSASAGVTAAPTPTGAFVAARGGAAYYLPSCSAAARIAEKNKIWFATRAEAERAGFKPAQNCKGL